MKRNEKNILATFVFTNLRYVFLKIVHDKQ
jgi:hypothetical protein